MQHGSSLEKIYARLTEEKRAAQQRAIDIRKSEILEASETTTRYLKESIISDLDAKENPPAPSYFVPPLSASVSQFDSLLKDLELVFLKHRQLVAHQDYCRNAVQPMTIAAPFEETAIEVNGTNQADFWAELAAAEADDAKSSP